MYLCEPEKLFLRPNVTYRFVVSDSCPDCVRLAEPYGYEPVDLSTWESEGGTYRYEF